MDSNKLPEGWQKLIDKPNPDSRYHWDRLDDQMRALEDFDEDDDAVDNLPEDQIDDISLDNENGPEDPPPASKVLPKRVLVFSTKNCYICLLNVQEVP